MYCIFRLFIFIPHKNKSFNEFKFKINVFQNERQCVLWFVTHLVAKLDTSIGYAPPDPPSK